MSARKSRDMTQDEARAFALSLPDTTEQSHMGRPDLRVQNKIFLTLPPDGRRAPLPERIRVSWVRDDAERGFMACSRLSLVRPSRAIMPFFRLFGSSTALLALLALLAGSGAGAQNNNCRPLAANTPTTGSLAKLNGSYLLLVYASSGPQAGRIAGGTLDLTTAAAPMRRNGTLYVGTASIDLKRVGARYAGSLLSRDPATPGVSIEVGGPTHKTGTVIFGSLRSKRADGSHAAPSTRGDVVEVSARGFRGFWRSTAPDGTSAAGYFCATRY